MAKLWKILRWLKDATVGAGGLSGWTDAGAESFEFQGLNVRCHVAWAQAGICDAWEKLAQRVPEATVFQRYDWQLAANTSAGMMEKQRLITVRKGDRLLAVLPLAVNGAGGLTSAVAGVSDYLDPLVDPEQSDASWRAIVAFLASQWDRALVEVAFHNIRESAAVRAVLPPIAREAGLVCAEAVVEHAPAITLPNSWDAYLASLDTRDRKELRRKMNKAETQGGAKLEISGAKDAEAALDRALRLMQAAAARKSYAIAQHVRPLLQHVGPSLINSGELEVLTLRLHREPACCLLQFPHPSGPMLYNMGWDAKWREWSPGIVAVGMAIRRAIGEEFKQYDLLRGREPYKYELGGVDRGLYRVTLRK